MGAILLRLWVAVSIVGVAIGVLAWPALGRTLLAYGLAARIPIALLMLVAMLGNWAPTTTPGRRVPP